MGSIFKNIFLDPTKDPFYGNLGGGPILPRIGLIFYAEAPELIATIGQLITNDQVRAELRSLFFDPEGTKYDNATIIANIKASSGVLNIYELVGDEDIGYALYLIGTPWQILDKALQYFRQIYGALRIDSAVLTIDNSPLVVQ